jgi:hypothetical protein
MKQPENSSTANQSGPEEISLPLTTLVVATAEPKFASQRSPKPPLFASSPYHGDVLVVRAFLFATWAYVALLLSCLIDSLLQIPSLRYLEPQNKGMPDSGE